MHLFHSRRELTLFAAGALLGALIAAGAVSLYFERNLIRAYAAQVLPPKYAAHTCLENAPPLRDGAQAWMTNPRPAPDGYTALCARLVIHGDVIPGSAVRCDLTYTTKAGQTFGPRSMCGTTLVGADGIAQIGLGIFDPALDQPVDLEVKISPDESSPEVYTAHTFFVYSLTPLGYPPP